MIKDFIIQELSDREESYIIIPTRYNSSLNILIESISKKSLKDGKIIVDQLLTKGSNSKRFLELCIKNHKIDMNYYNYITPDRNLTDFSYNLIKKLPKEVIDSIYPKSVRDEILSLK